MPNREHLNKMFKSINPALNTPRRDEPVASDFIYCDEPAVDDGSTLASVFLGLKSKVLDVFGLKREKQFVNALEDVIRRRGAPLKLITDRAQVEISQRVVDLLRALHIGDWQSEPLQQNQNPVERYIQTLKRMANTVLDRMGAPAFCWLLVLCYVAFILNHTSNATLHNQLPITTLTGSTGDISAILDYHFYQEVYYKLDDSDFPSSTKEGHGYWVGFSENVGHAFTYKVLTSDTQKIIHRGNIRPVTTDARNLRAEQTLGSNEAIPEIIKLGPHPDPPLQGITQTDIPVDDFLGRTFLMPPDTDGQIFRARIVELIEDHHDDVLTSHDHVKFRCSINNDEYEEVLAYNDIIHHIEREMNSETMWKFKRIVAHEGPLAPNHPNYRGSRYNVRMEWENGEQTDEPLAIIGADAPVECAIYARDNNLLDTEGWKRFKHIAKRQKKLFRMANQAKLRSYRTAPRYMYGYEVPRDYKHAIRLDDRNGNRKWRDCTSLEMLQLDEYEVFDDKGPNGKPPPDYKKIRVHLVYAVKHDGRHKARLVADGHLTAIPIDSVYSSVVTLRGLRIMLFLAELNKLDTWATDIGNAYLEAFTSELVFIIAGPEFGELAGHLLIIRKALYGLRSSGLRWHEQLAAVLQSMDFHPCKAEPDIWMREHNGLWEYVAVYVDDLAMSMQDPQAFVDKLINVHKFKLKGTGSIAFHLGCDFFRDDDGVLCMAPKKYIDKMLDSYLREFGERPNARVHSPLEKGDHPELDASDFLGPDGVRQYQSLIGQMQWAISLGRLDITTAIMTLSSFRALPRQGHLERAKRVIGYLTRFKDAMLRIRVDEPDYSDVPDPDYNWKFTVYGDCPEELPHNMPTPLGNFVTHTTYVDANLYHDMITGRSVTGILHLFNQFPVDWYSKKQNTVETATYGSEFVAARTAVEQIIDLRNTLRYLGVPLRDKTIMFGDNESVTDSASKPHAKLHKRHNMLSFHRVREAISKRVCSFHHIPGEFNPADVLSKHWGHSQVWHHLLRPLLFWMGDTWNMIEE